MNEPEVLPDTGQPIGAKVDAKPAPRPGPVALRGRLATVERLDAARHGKALWDAFRGRDALWTYSSNGPFAVMTMAYTLTPAQIIWLRREGKRRQKGGASGVLRDLLAEAMATEREQEAQAIA